MKVVNVAGFFVNITTLQFFISCKYDFVKAFSANYSGSKIFSNNMCSHIESHTLLAICIRDVRITKVESFCPYIALNRLQNKIKF